MAQLRLVRTAGPGFIGDCVGALLEAGTEGVLSPPLPRSAQRSWRDAGFTPHTGLALMRRRLDSVPPPGHLVVVGGSDDIAEVLRIDAAAFSSFWRFDAAALTESMNATSVSVLLVVRGPESGLSGFAVAGMGSRLAYLQRVAVDPRQQRTGMGRSLVRAAARWAARQGAGTIMLNTMHDNPAAMHLYEAEGFDTLDEPLEVLRSA